MKEFGKKYGINVEAPYAGIDWDFWRKMRAESGKATE
jgi:hypothetical protein